jgi:hypothetical protein
VPADRGCSIRVWAPSTAVACRARRAAGARATARAQRFREVAS